MYREQVAVHVALTSP